MLGRLPFRPAQGTLRAPWDNRLSIGGAARGDVGGPCARHRLSRRRGHARSSLASVLALRAGREERAPGRSDRGPGLRKLASRSDRRRKLRQLSMRLLLSLAAGHGGADGRATATTRFRAGPVDRALPAARDGARGSTPREPLRAVHRARGRCRGRYSLPLASAREVLRVLLAGLLAEGRTTVIEPTLRATTRRLLARAGVGITRDGYRIAVTGPDELELESPTITATVFGASHSLAAVLGAARVSASPT